MDRRARIPLFEFTTPLISGRGWACGSTAWGKQPSSTALRLQASAISTQSRQSYPCKDRLRPAASEPPERNIFQSYLNAMALRLNQRPRKTLGFQTPADW